MKLFLLTLILPIVTLVFASQVVFAASNATINVTANVPVCGDNVKDVYEQCDGSSLGGRQCSYLGFDSGTLLCSASCEYKTSSCTTTAEKVAEPVFSAKTGGSYTVTNSAGSVKIKLPPNFYTQDLRFQIFVFNKTVAQSSSPAPEGKGFVGNVYNFLFLDTNGNRVSTTSKPADVTLSYTNADTNGFDTGTLAPYYRASGSTIWHLLSGYTVNTGNKTIIFTVNSPDSFAIFGSKSASILPVGSSSSSGGGGNMNMVPAPIMSTVTLSGRAYPGSIVTILKDAVAVASVRAGEDARFSVAVGGLSAGTYLFNVYAKDSKGNRSSLATIPASVTNGVSVNESGIFLAPTISIDKSEVKRGDPVRVFGQTSPKSTVTISVHSDNKLFYQTPSDKNGVYSYSFLTTPLAIGMHTTNVRSSEGGEVGRTSSSISFAVGTQNVKKQKTKVRNISHSDMNNDKKVNIVDFSIASFWYNKPNPPAKNDINGDGIVNIVDFSIMAFNWTG